VSCKSTDELTEKMFTEWGETKDDIWIVATLGRIFIDSSYSVWRLLITALEYSSFLDLKLISIYQYYNYQYYNSILYFPSILITRILNFVLVTCYIFIVSKIILSLYKYNRTYFVVYIIVENSLIILEETCIYRLFRAI